MAGVNQLPIIITDLAVIILAITLFRLSSQIRTIFEMITEMAKVNTPKGPAPWGYCKVCGKPATITYNFVDLCDECCKKQEESERLRRWSR